MGDVRSVAARYAESPDEEAALLEAARRRLSWRARRGFRRCSSCREAKPPTAFGRNASAPDGLAHYCLECGRRRDRARRARTE